MSDSPSAQGPATSGDSVLVHYTGRLDNGVVFDSSTDGDPLAFTLGGGQVIPGFDSGVTGLTVGESATIRIEPEDAYGERDEELLFGVPAEHAPEGLQAGMQVQVGERPAVVLQVTEEMVVLDANHPLAGQTLTFDLQLVAIN